MIMFIIMSGFGGLQLYLTITFFREYNQISEFMTVIFKRKSYINLQYFTLGEQLRHNDINDVEDQSNSRKFSFMYYYSESQDMEDKINDFEKVASGNFKEFNELLSDLNTQRFCMKIKNEIRPKSAYHRITFL